MNRVYVNRIHGIACDPQFVGHEQPDTAKNIARKYGFNESNHICFELPKLQGDATDLTKEEAETWILKNHDLIINVYPRGGDALRFAIVIAISIVAPQVGAGFAGALHGTAISTTFASSTIAAFGSGAFILGAGLLLNKIIPPPLPAHGDPAIGSSASRSPTFSGSSQNIARIGQPPAILYGRHRVVCDLITLPYSRFVSNEQVLYNYLHVSQGEVDIERIDIGESPAEDYQDAEVIVRTYPPNTRIQEFDFIEDDTFRTELTATSPVTAGRTTPYEDIFNNDEAAPYRDLDIEYVIILQEFFNLTQSDGTTVYWRPPSNVRFFIDYILHDGNDNATTHSVEVNRDFERLSTRIIPQFFTIPFTGFHRVGREIIEFDANKSYKRLQVRLRITNTTLKTTITLERATTGNIDFPHFNVYPNPTLSTGIELESEFSEALDATREGQLIANDLLEIDISAPRGIGFLRSDGRITSQTITIMAKTDYVLKSGTTGSIEETFTVSGVTRDQQLYSFRLGTEATNRNQWARAKVSVKRDGGTGLLNWIGLKAKFEAPAQVFNSTIIAVRATAKNRLNTTNFGQISVIATRKLPIWTGTTWSEPRPTRNPMDAVADILRNPAHTHQVRDIDIDIDSFQAIRQELQDEGITFDSVFDRATSTGEAIDTILAVGRVGMNRTGNRFSFYRDKLDPTPITSFTPLNVIRGEFSMRITTIRDDNIDGVQIQYANEDKRWRQDSVRYPTDARRPTTFNVPGITQIENAIKYTRYLWNVREFQRVEYSFSVRTEGRIIEVGQRASIAMFPTDKLGMELVVSVERNESQNTIILTLANYPPHNATHIQIKNKNGSVVSVPILRLQPLTISYTDSLYDNLLRGADEGLVETILYASMPDLCIINSVEVDEIGNTNIEATRADNRIYQDV